MEKLALNELAQVSSGLEFKGLFVEENKWCVLIEKGERIRKMCFKDYENALYFAEYYEIKAAIWQNDGRFNGGNFKKQIF